MLTADVRSLPVNSTHYLWVIELDQEHGCLPVLGRAGIHPWRDNRNRLAFSSETTGVSYSCPVVAGNIELWTESRRFIAVFSDETRMLTGEQVLADGNLIRLPPCIRRALAAGVPGGFLEEQERRLPTTQSPGTGQEANPGGVDQSMLAGLP